MQIQVYKPANTGQVLIQDRLNNLKTILESDKKMTTLRLHATPYNLDASGFYFTNAEEYKTKSSTHFDNYGILVEEFEIQFIDGDDAALFNACSINQSNLNIWFDDIEFLQDYEKVNLYYLVAIAGYNLEQALNKIDEPSISESNLLDAATELFDECYLHSVPANVHCYIAYDQFARDCQLGGDMCEFEYASTTYTCTNANGL